MFSGRTATHLIALGFFIMAGTATADALQLVTDGRAHAVIVLPDDAIAAERTAAAELAEHLRRMTGADFPVHAEAAAAAVAGVRILVGPSAAARALFVDADALDALTGDAFRIRTADNAIALIGGRPRGTLYAVYSFLERDLGVRWLNWFDEQHIPRYRDLTVPSIDRQEAPAFPVRDIIVRTNRLTARDELRDFLVRNKCQGPELMFTGNIEAYGGVSHRYVIDPVRPNFLLIHTLHRFISPRDYFDAHPEYFTYDAARERRVSDRQLCFSNPDLVALLNDKVLAAIAENGGRGIVNVTAMDVRGPICQCPDCAAVSEAEGTGGAPLLKYIVEDLAPVVAERYPEAVISTLAYRHTRPAPATLRFPENVLIVWAPIGSDFARPFTHPNNAESLQEFRDWSAISPTMWIWYYPEPYRVPLAMGNLRERYAEDFRLFRDAGVQGLFLQTGGPGQYDRRRLACLSHWLMTKLMWDPDQDVDVLIADFVGHFYGPAAPMLLEYVMDLEVATAEGGEMGWDTNLDSFRFMTAARLTRWQALFDRAMEATAQAPQFAARTAYARMSLDHATLRTWTLQGLDAVMPVSRGEVAQRYMDTYEMAIRERRIDAENRRRADDAYAVTIDQLHAFAQLEPFKPLPPPLDNVAEERVRQISPEGVHTKRWELVDLVPDTEGAGGVAARITLDPAKPMRVAHYERTKSPGGVVEHKLDIRPEDVPGAGYHLYHVCRSPLSDMGYVYTRGWQVQFHDTKYVFDPEHPDKEYDIYVSLKLSGGKWDGDGAADVPEHVWIDRIVLVDTEDAASYAE